MTCDTHVHFFSPAFFTGLAAQLPTVEAVTGSDVATRLGWDDPQSCDALADRWVDELDKQGISRAALIASLPHDAPSVASAVTKHPSRFVGFFMVDPTREDASTYVARSLESGLRTICLFPSMHRYPLHDERVTRIFDVAAHTPSAAVFIHCGLLTVGVRKRLGLASPFDIRFGNPLDVHGLAMKFPKVSIIVPHFGAGMLREALMLADLCPNVHLDTSSSNSWMRFTPGLTLEQVFEATLATIGPDRVVFGTDSSSFPRGWHREIYMRQRTALDEIGAGPDVQARIFGENFDRLFPLT